MGLHRAGFDVTGVDIEPQPNYPFRFIQADALTFDLSGYDVICASPKCQPSLSGLKGVNEARGRTWNHGEDQIPAVRERLLASGLPFIIENIVGAPLIHPVMLCGSMFGLQVRRHRLFESNIPLLVPNCRHSIWREAKYPTNYRPHGKVVKSKVVQVYGNSAGTKHWPEAMGIDWMTTDELTQAIPPAFSEYLGRQVITYLNNSSEVAA